MELCNLIFIYTRIYIHTSWLAQCVRAYLENIEIYGKQCNNTHKVSVEFVHHQDENARMHMHTTTLTITAIHFYLEICVHSPLSLSLFLSAALPRNAEFALNPTAASPDPSGMVRGSPSRDGAARIWWRGTVLPNVVRGGSVAPDGGVAVLEALSYDSTGERWKREGEMRKRERGTRN